MKLKDFFFIAIILSVFIISCNPELDVELPDYTSKLVVEGSIEVNKYPQVILTRNASYFEDIDSASIRKYIVSIAKVTVSDGETEEILTFKKNSNAFPPYFYQGTSMKGIEGKTYSLKIELEGQVYTSSTTIPRAAALDSIWFQSSDDNINQGLIYGKFNDPANEQNFYRILTKRQSKDQKFIPVYYSAIPDVLFNGKQFNFSLFRGAESLSNIKDDMYFDKGDTVFVKFCSIDRGHFQFWSTLENELYMAGNPFASSGNKVVSNISNNAVGIWGGYGVKYYRVIAK